MLQLPFPRRNYAIDWLGAFFIVGGISALLLMLSLGGKAFAWNSVWTYGLTALALVMFGLAVWQDRRAAEPIMPLRLFANHTFLITSAAGFVVGVAMFGAIIFLPQYLQIVKGQSPTASGLQTFPMMSRLAVDTSLWVAGIYMFVTGVGIGTVMQVLVLGAQNAVDHSDLGVATSGATFFRSLGGAMGVALFGALLTHRLRDTIPAQLKAAGVSPSQMPNGSATQATSEQIANLPDTIHLAVTTGFADALQALLLAAVPFAVLGLVILVFLRETPLRETRGHTASQNLAEALETSVDADAYPDDQPRR